MKKIKWLPLAVFLGISIGVGLLAALFTGNSSELYDSLNLPPFAPPSVLFPIVWSVLYVLMGISAYMIYVSEASDEGKKTALSVFFVQLAANFLWPVLFFSLELFFAAFVVLAVLAVLVFIMILLFYRIKPLAAYLQIPYLLWVTFAGVLNFYIAFNN